MWLSGKKIMLKSFSFTLSIYSIMAQINNADKPIETSNSYTQEQSWIWGSLAALLVSLLGLFIPLLLVPVFKSKKITADSIESIVIILIAFAAGALFGDTIIHIIPDVFGTTDSEESSFSSSIASLIICCGMTFFILLDKIFLCCGISSQHNHNHSSPPIDYVVEEENRICPNRECEEPIQCQELELKENLQTVPIEDKEKFNSLKDDSKSKKSMPNEIKEVIQKSSLCSKWLNSFRGKDNNGYMILFAGLIHNVMDGLAVGAAFASRDKNFAFSTFIAILAHEIPHELGDISILIHSKFGICQALFCNTMINFASLIGAIIGLEIGNINETANKYIMSFVAGNFFHISCVNMIPMIINNKNKSTSLLQILMFTVGLGVMFVVLTLEM